MIYAESNSPALLKGERQLLLLFALIQLSLAINGIFVYFIYIYVS
jgi:hypothetical protein